ncbi:MAG: patatin-like phospholipase family protein [Corallococcus sp.]|nr:patatin-like phospholipase family protein [Corallococcus sp.]
MKLFSGIKPNDKIRRKYKLGLALSGGGTRGFAHIGALRAFDENGLKFDCVAGTSVGSLMGAAYCLGIEEKALVDFCYSVKDKDIVTSRIFKIGSPASNIEAVADKLFGGATFADVKIPFACVAVDLVSGNEVVLNKGSLAKACSASCAVPVVFTPVETNGMTLVDGGVLNNIPADVCRQMGAETVISVDLNHTRGEGTTSRKFREQLSATWRILTKSTAYKGIVNSDVIIEPELRIFKNTTISGIDEMIYEGYRAAVVKMPEIKELLGIKK